MDAPEIEDRLRELLADRPEIAAAYLFGSVARGTACAKSDVDVAVLFAQPPPRTLDGLPVGLQSELSAALGRSVDLIVLNRAPVDLVHRVLRDGRLLVNRDASRRIAFELRARNEYYDLLPFLRLYRRLGPSAP